MFLLLQIAPENRRSLKRNEDFLNLLMQSSQVVFQVTHFSGKIIFATSHGSLTPNGGETLREFPGYFREI